MSFVPFDPKAPVKLTVAHKSYPCPECGESHPSERVKFARTQTQMSRREASHPEAEQEAIRQMSRQLADMILHENLYLFRKFYDKDEGLDTRFEMVVGILHPNVMEKFEDRVKEHQEKIAAKVVDEAQSIINHWGSAYGWHDISKDEACRFIREALHKIVNPE